MIAMRADLLLSAVDGIRVPSHTGLLTDTGNEVTQEKEQAPSEHSVHHHKEQQQQLQLQRKH